MRVGAKVTLHLKRHASQGMKVWRPALYKLGPGDARALRFQHLRPQLPSHQHSCFVASFVVNVALATAFPSGFATASSEEMAPRERTRYPPTTQLRKSGVTSGMIREMERRGVLEASLARSSIR